MPGPLLRAKCVILGDPAAGKSAISQVFQTDEANFPKSYNMTMGVETAQKTLKLTDTDRSLEFHLVELSGHDVYSDFLPVVLEGVSIVILVLDVVSEAALKSCENWMKKIRELGCKFKVGAVLATKIDLEQRRVIQAEEGEDFAKRNGLAYFEVSAKTGQGIQDAFQTLASDFHKHYITKVASFQTMAV
eukprot:m.22802 g.22802  ORF g.22802 m.22802 type:complete len:189 (+) comp8371_c0_seq1:2125-2691(+)